MKDISKLIQETEAQFKVKEAEVQYAFQQSQAWAQNHSKSLKEYEALLVRLETLREIDENEVTVEPSE